MKYKVEHVTIEDEFKICPACGYEDGFHSMMKREQERCKWLFICPSCHRVFVYCRNIDILDRVTFWNNRSRKCFLSINQAAEIDGNVALNLFKVTHNNIYLGIENE